MNSRTVHKTPKKPSSKEATKKHVGCLSFRWICKDSLDNKWFLDSKVLSNLDKNGSSKIYFIIKCSWLPALTVLHELNMSNVCDVQLCHCQGHCNRKGINTFWPTSIQNSAALWNNVFCFSWWTVEDEVSHRSLICFALGKNALRAEAIESGNKTMRIISFCLSAD